MKPTQIRTCNALFASGLVAIVACNSSSSGASPPASSNPGPDGASTSNGDSSSGSADSSAGTDASAGSDFGFTPSNVPLTSFPADVDDVTLSASPCVIDTDQLTIDCVSPEPDGGTPYAFALATQSDGSQAAVLSVNSLTIEAAANVMLRGGAPLIVWAWTTVNIQGPLIADPTFHPTNGGGAVPTASGAGGGPGGGPAGTSNPEIGSGGGGYCGTGGAGGNSEIVAADTGAPLPGGKSYGNATITPLIGGSAGGSVLGRGGGGEGGGAIEIAAGMSILVGSGGIVSVPGYGGEGNGGGGGSGGSILFEAPAITIHGVLAANGGGAAVFSGGGNAQDGQPSAQPAMGQDANSAVGAAGTQINGGDGINTTTATSSGGGAAGRIRINTSTGSATIESSAVVSPALTTPCATQGTLAP